MKKIFSFILALTLIFSVAVNDVQPSYAYSKVYYNNYGVTDGIVCYTTRTKVVSKLTTKRITYTKKKKIGQVKNTGKKAATKSISFSENRTRTFNFSVSADVPIKCLKQDVKATLGGALSYSKTVTISTSAVYMRYEKEVATYMYTCQDQQQDIGGNWYNKGKPYVKYATVTTKVPELIV